jgi:putative heme iron utilization protein
VKQDAAARAAALLGSCRIAALGTLAADGPSVTMTPYAIALEPFAFVLLVSGLASHTRQMRADPHVAMMVVEPETTGTPPHALARVSIRGVADPIAADTAGYASARAVYLERFPDVSQLFELGDFGLFAVEPRAVRVVLGFAQAASLAPQTLTTALRALR